MQNRLPSLKPKTTYNYQLTIALNEIFKNYLANKKVSNWKPIGLIFSSHKRKAEMHTKPLLPHCKYMTTVKGYHCTVNGC